MPGPDAEFFVVERRAGREYGAVYYDQLPGVYSGKRAQENGLVYAMRIDRLPEPERERWRAMSVHEKFDEYQKLAARGALPQNTVDAPKPADLSAAVRVGLISPNAARAAALDPVPRDNAQAAEEERREAAIITGEGLIGNATGAQAPKAALVATLDVGDLETLIKTGELELKTADGAPFVNIALGDWASDPRAWRPVVLAVAGIVPESSL